jgi:PAS domain S-box-containing protein
MAQEVDKQREYLYRCFVENNQGYAIIFFDEDGFITNWNEGAERIFDWTAEEMIGRHSGTIFTPEEREQNKPEQEMRVAREQGWAADDGWHVCKDGSRIWVNGLMNAIHDEQGEFLGFSKVIRDETRKQEMQEALNRTSMENERILTAITDAVYRLDAQWCFTYLNPQAERMLERSKNDLLGKNIWEALPAKIDTSFYPQFHRAMNEKVPVHFVEAYPTHQQDLRRACLSFGW